jgi:hypothetical protein
MKVLVNGFIGSSFGHGRGLRQRDPISPFDARHRMDVLSSMFRAAEQAGVLADLASVGLRHRVSLYADDVGIFAKPCPNELAAI